MTPEQQAEALEKLQAFVDFCSQSLEPHRGGVRYCDYCEPVNKCETWGLPDEWSHEDDCLWYETKKFLESVK